MTDPLRYDADPELVDPILIAAFRGWNDAGEAATGAARYVADAADAHRFATLDSDGYVDYQFHRPTVEISDGVFRNIEWPDTTFRYGRLPGVERDVIVANGWEPSMRWRSFCAHTVDLAQRFGVQRAFTLGGVLSDIPHTRPVYVLGTAPSLETIDRLGLQTSRYEGPTGIVTILTHALQEAGIEAVSLWAHVPYYARDVASPKATMAIVEQIARLSEAAIDIEPLAAETEKWEAYVADIVSSDTDLAMRVAELEARAQDELSATDPELADDLGEQFERYLRHLNDRET